MYKNLEYHDKNNHKNDEEATQILGSLDSQIQDEFKKDYFGKLL